MKRLNDAFRRNYSLGILLLYLVILTSGNAGAARKPLIYGICTRPFPAIFQLDYAWCRADAWLSALQSAASRLPVSVNQHLNELGLDVPLGRLAIASILYPLDVVTPEKANSRQIRVFLKDAPRFPLDQLFRDFSQILPQMALIWETSQTVMAMRTRWPAEIEQTDLVPLEQLGSRLDRLWRNDVTAPADSAPLLLAAAQSGPGTRESMRQADSALKIILDRSVTASSPGERNLWNLLAAKAVFLRGQGHQLLGESGLAETDYSTSLARLQSTPGLMALKGEIAHRRGALRQSLGKFGLMCSDYAFACSAGLCQGLAEARRNGLCSEAQHTSHSPQ